MACEIKFLITIKFIFIDYASMILVLLSMQIAHFAVKYDSMSSAFSSNFLSRNLQQFFLVLLLYYVRACEKKNNTFAAPIKVITEKKQKKHFNMKAHFYVFVHKLTCFQHSLHNFCFSLPSCALKFILTLFLLCVCELATTLCFYSLFMRENE